MGAMGSVFGSRRGRRVGGLAGLALAALLVLPAQASEFGSYRRPDPAAFAEGVKAYDGGDYARAYEIWLPLARHQDPAAMRNVGQLLRRGLGVPQDLRRAMIFYKRAASFGVAGAQANLAMMYYEGEGLKARDPKEAARWFLAAARQGHVLSQFQLGKMLEEGDGVPLNMKAARVFYSVAAKAGHGPAVERLAAVDIALGTVEPPEPGTVAAAPPQVATPRPRPDDAAALAAAFLLRGSLTEDLDALQMAPDELFALRRGGDGDLSQQEAILLGLDPAMTRVALGPDTGEGESCGEPGNPFDRRALTCRMPPAIN